MIFLQIKQEKSQSRWDFLFAGETSVKHQVQTLNYASKKPFFGYC